MTEMNNTTENKERLGARSLLKKIFSDAGAHLEELENGRMTFSYGYGDGESENFIVESDDEHMTIRLLDCCWHEVSRWDIDEVIRIQSLVNKLNAFARSKVVYHFSDDDKMYLTTLLTCPLYPEIPDIFNYLTSQLDDMVQTHNFFCSESDSAEEETQAEEVAEPAAKEVADEANDGAHAVSQAKSCEEIVLESLRQLQCEPEVEDRGDGVHTIYFEYQAEHFSINVEAKSRFVALFDAFWYSFEETDLEQLSNVKHIVNNINWSSSLNVCYNITEENNMINLHTTYSMLCFEEVDFTAYLRHILRECFVVHNNFFKQIAEASAKNKD